MLLVLNLDRNFCHIFGLLGQRKKKVVSDSPGLVYFAIGLVNSVFILPDGQVIFFRNSNNRRTVKPILLVKELLGLVEMTSGLVNASFSLPEWQAVKMIFFAPYRLIGEVLGQLRTLREHWDSESHQLGRPPFTFTEPFTCSRALSAADHRNIAGNFCLPPSFHSAI